MKGIRQSQRDKLNERAERCCEICGKPGNNAHHRKNSSQGGNDDLSNLLLLCGSGTTGCHGFVTEHPGEAKRKGWSVWRSDISYDVPVYYRGSWARIDDGGHVNLLKKGQVRNDLGHLSID